MTQLQSVAFRGFLLILGLPFRWLLVVTRHLLSMSLIYRDRLNTFVFNYNTVDLYVRRFQQASKPLLMLSLLLFSSFANARDRLS